MPVGQRTQWQFGFDTSEVKEGAERKLSHHRNRQEYWKEQQEKAVKAIEAKGIDIREYDVTGGKRHEVVVDPSLSNRLSESRSKFEAHRTSADEYEDWVQILGRNDPQKLQLDWNDVLYFGLGKSNGS